MTWVIQQWLSVHWKDSEPRSCAVREARCLSSSSLALKAWKIPGDPLTFSPCWEAIEAGLWCQWRTAAAVTATVDALTSEEAKVRSKQAMAFSFKPPCIWAVQGRLHPLWWRTCPGTTFTDPVKGWCVFYLIPEPSSQPKLSHLL